MGTLFGQAPHGRPRGAGIGRLLTWRGAGPAGSRPQGAGQRGKSGRSTGSIRSADRPPTTDERFSTSPDVALQVCCSGAFQGVGSRIFHPSLRVETVETQHFWLKSGMLKSVAAQ
jgi:hypothetical protein